MSENFKPSVDAAKNALGDVKIERRDHPSGAKGASLSLDEVAKRIREGRLDPRIRAWAGQVLVDAGKPKDVIDQSQAILEALRKKTMYTPDPVGAEYMVAAKNTLCLDEQGLCMVAGDCDDLSVALGSALMSVGIPVKVVGQSFNSSPVPSHVMIAIETKFGWKRIDPSSSTFEVGSYYPAKKETWIDPIDTKPVTILGEGPVGDFVGVGLPPNMVAAIPVGIGDLVGLGDLSTTEKNTVFDAATSQVHLALETLHSAIIRLETSVDQVSQTRGLLRPDDPFDPEPNFKISSVADFPGNGIWTRRMADVTTQIWDTANQLLNAGNEALNGVREILIDQKTREIYIKSISSDPWRWHPIQTATDTIIGVFDAAGNILAGFSSKDGKNIPKEQIGQTGISGIPVGVGTPLTPVIVIGVAVAAALASIAVYYTISKLCDTAEIVAKEASNKTIVECVTSGKCTAEQGNVMLKSISENRRLESVARAKEKSEPDPISRSLESFGKIIMWATIGGVTAYGLYLAAPLIKDTVEGAVASKKARRMSS